MAHLCRFSLAYYSEVCHNVYMMKTTKQFTKWNETETKASKMDNMALAYSFGDCLAAAATGLDESYYNDEATVYARELTRRGVDMNSDFVGHYVRRAREV